MPTNTTTTTTRRRSGRVSTTVAATDNTPPTPAPDSEVVLSSAYYTRGRTARFDEVLRDIDGGNILSCHAVEVGGDNYHRDDSRICGCGRCGNTNLRDGMIEVVIDRNGHRELWCESCEECNTWECDGCDNHVSEGVQRAYRSEDRDHSDPLCPSCRPREDNLYGRLLNYSNKAISAVPPADTSSMLFGLEVETHVRGNQSVDEAIRELHRLVGGGYYVTKSDGSLVNGFEIVTRPDSMRIHREQWLRIFEAIDSSTFLKENLRSWNAPRQCCGIHCHVDKSMLSQLHLGKLHVFINHKGHRDFIEKIAGRGSNSYTSFRDDVKIIDGRRLKAGTSPERYVALNVTQHTAEMRLFRGTLNPDAFFRILDFIEASVEWTGMGNCSARSVTNVGDFSAYVHKNPHRYPFLLTKLQEWGITPSKLK